MHLVYAPQTANAKTGNIPQQYIGATDAESESTCIGCPLLHNTKRLPDHPSPRVNKFGLRCYAHRGRIRIAHKHIASRPKHEQTLAYALRYRHIDARYFRLGARGDIAAIPKSTFKRHYNRIRQSKLGVLAYTHFYLRAPWLRHYALASVDTVKQAHDAIGKEWRAAIHLPDTSPATLKRLLVGVNYKRCLHEIGKATCNTCGLCDVKRKTSVQLIVFTEG